MIEDRYLVLFGDMYDAVAPGWSKFQKGNGDVVIKIKLKPNKNLRLKYKVRNEDYDPVDGYIYKEYPFEYLAMHCDDERNCTLFLLCDYEGKVTEFQQRLVGDLMEQISYWKNQVKTLRLKNVGLTKELEKERSQHEESDLKDAERIEKIRKMAGKDIEFMPPQQMGAEYVH